MTVLPPVPTPDNRPHFPEPDKASDDYACGFVDGIRAALRKPFADQVEQYLRDVTEGHVTD